MPMPATTRPSAKRLPPVPVTTELHTSVVVRLDAIRTVALPEVERCRALLERVWYSPANDAVLLHLEDGLAVPSHPAGADRLATIIAERQALLREMAALRDLEQALQDYEAGGRQLRAELEDAASPPEPLSKYRLAPAPADPSDPSATEEQRYLGWLQAYLRSIRGELADALTRGDEERVEVLRQEHDALRAYLSQRTTRCDHGAFAPTQREPRRSDRTRARTRRVA